MKKSILILTLFMSLICMINAQTAVPNGDFETWAGGEATNWVSSNAPGTVIPITESNDAHTGNSAARGECLEFIGVPFVPSLTAGSLIDPFVPVSGTPMTFDGYYKLSLNDEVNDMVSVAVNILDANLGLVAQGVADLNQNTSTYTQFSVQLDYLNANTPAFAQIQIAMVPNSGLTAVGSWFLVDDVMFDGTTAIEPVNSIIPADYQLQQNYPNPFNPSTTIDFSIARQGTVDLSIYNALGQLVESLLNENLSPGNYSVNWQAGQLPSGTYFYRLSGEGFQETRRMLFTK